MAKFYGVIGYASLEEQTEGGVPNGVFVEGFTERSYFGDILQDTRRLSSNENLNDDVELSNRISVIADPFAIANFRKIRYVEFMGAKWKVSSAEVQYPRIILTVGGVYNVAQT